MEEWEIEYEEWLEEQAMLDSLENGGALPSLSQIEGDEADPWDY